MTTTLKAAAAALALTLAGTTFASAGPGHRHGALAAGLIGGLALGIIASQAAQPVYAETECYVARKRFIDRYGRVVVRPVEICE